MYYAITPKISVLIHGSVLISECEQWMAIDSSHQTDKKLDKHLIVTKMSEFETD